MVAIDLHGLDKVHDNRSLIPYPDPEIDPSMCVYVTTR